MALLFQSDCRLPTAVLLLSSVLLAWAPAARAQDVAAPQYLATFELHTAEELLGVLERAEALLLAGSMSQDVASRVTLLLHGPEVRVLLRQNYGNNKEVVDLAARLSALGVVKIQACQTWMGGNRVDEADLQPFVTTVPYAVDEARRLVEEQNYVYF